MTEQLGKQDHKLIAMVVGGSSTIGRAVAVRLAQTGIKVYIGYKSGQDRAEATVAEIRASGGNAHAICLDVGDPDAPERTFSTIVEKEGSLDILVNAAGLNMESPAALMEDSAWHAVLDTNLHGVFRTCRAAAKYMILRKWGRIINISSIAALRGGRGQIAYAVSKAGLEALTRVLAIELGRKGLTVNCIAPGVIESPMSERIRRDYGGELLSHIAVGRFGASEDIAGLVRFLCSDEASYITGQVLRVDGGLGL